MEKEVSEFCLNEVQESEYNFSTLDTYVVFNNFIFHTNSSIAIPIWVKILTSSRISLSDEIYVKKTPVY